jgi:hypothetical protein
MAVLAIDRSEVRPLLNHVALCLTVGGSLGLVAAVFAGLDLYAFMAFSCLVQGIITVACIASSFAIFWCSPDGPDRWRPFIVSHRVTEAIFGTAATIIVLGGMAAVVAIWLK